MNNNEIFQYFLANAIITRRFELKRPIYIDVPARLPRRKHNRKKWRIVKKFIARFGYRQELDGFQTYEIFTPADLPEMPPLGAITYEITIRPGPNMEPLIQPDWKDLPSGISHITITSPLGVEYTSQRVQFNSIICRQGLSEEVFRSLFINDFLQRHLDQEMMMAARRNFITKLTVTSR